ncbi:MAG: FG-GAP-like repeat-containing protein [Planctomycetota bacterium]
MKVHDPVAGLGSASKLGLGLRLLLIAGGSLTLAGCGAGIFSLVFGRDSGDSTSLVVSQSLEVANVSALAVSGPTNDTITATFNQPLDGPTALLLDRYRLESPPGTVRDLSNAEIRLNPETTVVTILLTQTAPSAVNLQFGQEFRLTLEGLVGRNPNIRLDQPAVIDGVVAGDATPPEPSVEILTVSGPDNDRLTVQFDEAVTPASAIDVSRFQLESPPGRFIDLSSARADFDSTRSRTTLTLTGVMPGLQSGDDFSLLINGISDLAGNTIVDSLVEGTVQGDFDPPRLLAATLRDDLDATKRTVDLFFDEELDPTLKDNRSNFSLNRVLLDVLGSSVIAFDQDGDGDTDLLVGGADGTITLHENPGTFAPPEYFYGDRIEAQLLDTGTRIIISALSSGEQAGARLRLHRVAASPSAPPEFLLVTNDTGQVRLFANIGPGTQPTLPPQWTFSGDLQLPHGTPVLVWSGSASAEVDLTLTYTSFDADQFRGGDVAILDWNDSGLGDLIAVRKAREIASGRNFLEVLVFEKDPDSELPINIPRDFLPPIRIARILDADVQCGECLPGSVRVFDWNLDGQQDLLVGLTDRVYFFENLGPGQSPRFADPVPIQDRCGQDLVVPSGNVRSVELAFIDEPLAQSPPPSAFAYDLIIGTDDGRVLVYSNILSGPGPCQPIRLQTSAVDLNTVSFAAPSFVDLNGDGDLDLLAGDEVGNLLLFRSAGVRSSQQDAFAYTRRSVLGEEPPLADGFSVPRPRDLNGDPFIDIVMGDSGGKVSALLGQPAQPGSIDPNEPIYVKGNLRFFEFGNPSDPQLVTSRAAPELTDLDLPPDGRADLIVGGREGKLTFFRNIGDVRGDGFPDIYEDGNPDVLRTEVKVLIPNPPGEDVLVPIDVGENAVPVFGDMDDDGDLDLLVGSQTGDASSIVGQVTYFENIGDGGLEPAPEIQVFRAKTVSGDPLNLKNYGIDLGRIDLKPELVDLDGDGNLDLVVGDFPGNFSYFRNAGGSALDVPFFDPREPLLITLELPERVTVPDGDARRVRLVFPGPINPTLATLNIRDARDLAGNSVTLQNEPVD